MHDLWRNIGFTSAARAYSVVAGAASLVITARALGPEGRGVVAAAVTWSLLFSTLGYLSLGQVAIHRATGKPAEEWLRPTLAALLAMTVFVTVAGWVVAAAMYGLSGGHAFGEMPAYAAVLGFATLPFLVWEQYGSSLLIAVGRISVYNRAEVAGRTAGLVVIVVVVGFAGGGVAGALIALLVGQALVAAAGTRYLRRLAGGPLRVDRATLRDLVIGGLKLHFNAVGVFLFASAAVLIVQSVRGPSETGPFQVAVQLITVALLIPQAASMVLYGEVARLGPDAAWRANRRVLVTLTGLMLAVALVAYLIAPTVVPFAFGDGFKSVVPVFQILVLGLVGQTISTLMAPQWIGRGLFLQASAITVTLGVCNVVACTLLVHSHGMKGAAYSLLAVSTLSSLGNVVMALWVNRRVKREAAQNGPARFPACDLPPRPGSGDG